MGGGTTTQTPLDVTPEQPLLSASGANLPLSTLANAHRDSFAGNPAGYHQHMQRISGPQAGGWSDPNFTLTDAGTTTAGATAPGAPAPEAPAPKAPAPGTQAPETLAPGTLVPGTLAPGTPGLGAPAPEALTPGALAPGAPGPVSFAPGASPPEQSPTSAHLGNPNPSTALDTLLGLGQNVGRPLTAIGGIIGQIAGGLEAYPRYSTIQPYPYAEAAPLGYAQTGFPTNGYPGGWEGLVGGPVLNGPVPPGAPFGLGTPECPPQTPECPPQTPECPPQTPECPPPAVNDVVPNVPGRVGNLPVLGNSYTIAKGDNLTYIARQALGVNDGEPDPQGLQNVIDTIAQGNSIKNEDLIFAGASLTISDGMIKSALSPAKPCDKIPAQTPPVPENSQPTAPPGDGQPVAPPVDGQPIPPPVDGQPIAQPGVGGTTIV
jgi:hypothetical protein